MTVRFMADEDLDADITYGLRSREPAIDILDVKTAGLPGRKIERFSDSRHGKVGF